MTVYYNDGFCGSGKTYGMIDEIVRTRRPYIVAVDRIEVIDERIKAIMERAKALGYIPPPVEMAHSGNQKKTAYSKESTISLNLLNEPVGQCLGQCSHGELLLVTENGADR